MNRILRNKFQCVYNASENIVFEIADILSTGVWGKAYCNIIKETWSVLPITGLKTNRLYTVHELGNITIEEYHQHPYEPYDAVIKWKHFPRYWKFVRGFTGHRWTPHTKASEAELWCFLDQRLNKRLRKQWSGWWCENLKSLTPVGTKTM